MPFYEITFETGRSSVAEYADDSEAQTAIGNHHQRAINGDDGGPIGQPAERIARVRVYDKHPNELNPDQTLSADVATKQLTSLIKALSDDNGVVNLGHLAVEIRGLAHPMVTSKEHSFDSNFIMKEKRTLALDFLVESI